MEMMLGKGRGRECERKWEERGRGERGVKG